MLEGQAPSGPGEEIASAEPTDAPQKAKPRFSRSRGACLRCKQRRQKCDEKKPACSRCHDGSEKCTYTVNLQWGGRAFKSYKGNADIKKYETEPGTFVYVALSKQKSSPSRSSSPSERLSRSLSPLDSATPTEQLLLHHFANSASQITSCHPSIQISFNELLLPMAISYPPLLSALMALSAIHRNSLYTSPAIPTPQSTEIVYLKASSITQLRSDLFLPTQQQSPMRDAVLATALTLCMCEIHSGADLPRSWRLHLEGAKAILSSLPSTSSSSSTSQSGLLERWYTSIEALAAISSKGLRAGNLPPITSSSPGTPGLDAAREEVFLDDYFGFATDLVDAFKEIGAAAWERRSLSSSAASVSAHAMLSEEDLDTEARSLEQNVRDMIARDAAHPPQFYAGVREKLDEEVVREFYLCNETYQQSALLHVYRRVMRLDRAEERVQGCVTRILECVDGIRPRAGLSPYIVLTMPLFTAGREALGEDRERVRRAMTGLGVWLRLRNVWRSLELLEEGWERVDEPQDADNCDFIPY
ncbi:Fungal specific transcription factor domain containing protein [Hyaloscypha variabilis]